MHRSLTTHAVPRYTARPVDGITLDVTHVALAGSSRSTLGPARSFRTRQVDDPPGFVRTYGAFVDAREHDLVADDWAAAVERARSDVPADCARGKLAVIGCDNDQFSICAHQLADDGSDGDVVACSNATAAAAAALAESTGTARVDGQLDLPDGHHARFTATIGTDPAGVVHADQRWSGIQCAFDDEIVVDGRSCVRVRSGLNHYLLVRTKDAADLETVSLTDALRISHHFGHDEKPLQSRVAFVDVSGDRRRAAFFTCDQRRHPSAPLTGVAVLALAARFVDWLTPAAPLDVPFGTAYPPMVSWAVDGTAAIEFPRVMVDIEHPTR